MNDDTPDPRATAPQLSDKGRDEAERRQRRQAEALRANLARRKAQTRARSDEEADPGDPPATKG